MRRQSIVKSLTVVAALSTCAVAAPTAFASTDVPPPDTSKAVVVNEPTHIAPPDTSKAGPISQPVNNIAPPDTSKAVVVTQQPSTSSSDLRTPDAKAAAADPRAQTYATPTVIKVGSSGGGFDWGDAGIGAGGALAVVALAGGGLVLVSRRRTTHPRVSPTAG
jgi:hypothetical protein